MADQGDNVVRFGKPANANNATPPVDDAAINRAELAAELRAMAEFAESGDLVGVAVAAVHSNGGISTSWCIAPGFTHAAISAVTCLQRDVLELLDE